MNHFEVIPRKNVGLDVHLRKFPLSRGKIPGLTGPGVEITETIAIVTVGQRDLESFAQLGLIILHAQYLAKLSNRSKLFGDGSLEQEATVVSWMSWANQELLPTLALWLVIEGIIFHRGAHNSRFQVLASHSELHAAAALRQECD